MRADLMASCRHELRSQAIGETFRIDVAWPEFGVEPDQPLPVVYVMDANTVFGIAVQAARFLQNAGEMPPVLMVGVGYDLGGSRPRSAYGSLRTRDLTPSVDAEFLARQGVPQIEVDPPMGGADAFLHFLIDEVRPFVAQTYATQADDQTLTGSSLGGLFCLHALLTRPGAFRRHVANSPSLWWRGREAFDRLAKARDLSGVLFVSIGGLERDPPWNGVEDVAAFVTALQAQEHEALALTHHVFEGETHTSVIPAALSRGLRAVFTQGRLPSGAARA